MLVGSWLRKGLVLVVLAVLAGCSLPFGGSSSSSNNSGSSSSPSTGPGIAANKTLTSEIWFAGFHLTLGDVSYKPPVSPSPAATPVPSELTIAAKFENLGTDTTQFFARMSIGSNGQHYTDAGDSQKLPNVPGKATSNGVISFATDDKFNLDDAVLTVGDADTNQAVVPLGRSGTLKALEPRKLTLSGAVNQANEYTLNITGGILSYDDPATHREENAGMALVTLIYSVTGVGTSECCISRDLVSLKVPDGTAVAAEEIVPGAGLPPKGTTRQGDMVSFLVKTPPEGAYDAIFKSYLTTGQSADLAFTITPAGATGGGTGSTPGASPGGATGATPSSH